MAGSHGVRPARLHFFPAAHCRTETATDVREDAGRAELTRMLCCSWQFEYSCTTRSPALPACDALPLLWLKGLPLLIVPPAMPRKQAARLARPQLHGWRHAGHAQQVGPIRCRAHALRARAPARAPRAAQLCQRGLRCLQLAEVTKHLGGRRPLITAARKKRVLQSMLASQLQPTCRCDEHWGSRRKCGTWESGSHAWWP